MNWILAIVLLLSIGASKTVGAVPTESSPGPTVVNRTTSKVLRDSTSSRTLWVLPPTAGRTGSRTFKSETASAECDGLASIIESARLYSNMIRILAKQRNSALEAWEKHANKSSAEAIQLFTQTEALNALILGAHKTINDSISTSGKAHGGTLTIDYVHDQLANLEVVRTANPSFSDIQPIQTQNAQFFFTVPGSAAAGVDVSLLPIVRTYSVAGTLADELAKRQFQIAPRVSVTLALTRIGACFMMFPAKFGVDTDPKFGMTALYSHPQMFRTKVRATYNLLSVYSYLRQQGSSGGFFSSNTWSRTIESNWGRSAFHIEWKEEDPNSTISQAQRLEVERTIKADLLANLDTLIRTKLELPHVSAANPGPRGSTVLAEGLEKTCAANGYCAAAAIGLRVLDAIFGSSSMNTEIQKTLDVVATYAMDGETARLVPQGINYTAD